MRKIKLPQDVLFHHDLSLMVFRPRGVLNEKVVERIVAFLEKAEQQASRPFNRYSDLSKLQSVKLDYQYILRVSLHRRATYAKFPPVKSAFYVTTEEVASLVEIHAIVCDYSPLHVAMFREVEAAADWLGVSPEDLQVGDEPVQPP